MEDVKVRVSPRFWLGGGAGCGGTVDRLEPPIVTINGRPLTEQEQADWLTNRKKFLETATVQI